VTGNQHPSNGLQADRPTRIGRLLHAATRVSDRLALAGGVLLLALAVMVTVSVMARWLTSRGIPGDFELVQIGLALAVFAFMPLCQLRGGNLHVDTFTTRLPRTAQRCLDGFWSLVYAVVAGLIAAMMAVGAAQTIASGTSSMVLGLPIGWAIALAAVLATWLALVVLVTAVRAFARVQR
jgi:TRAP-type C4-dicarboxylate transport system permease small subunit